MRKVHVALLPNALTPDPEGVCAVVDVIRASTTLVTLAESGNPQVWLAADPDSARAAVGRFTSRPTLVGEEGGVAPSGFDFGNSPREIAQADLTGHTVIFATTNGTSALRRWCTSRRTYAAALRNVGAVAHRLLDAGRDITIVCASRSGEVALDDVYTAGAVVRRLLHITASVDLDETAVMALQVNRGYQSAVEALKLSMSAQLLAPVGLAEDVPFVAETDVSLAVPELGGDGRLRLLEDL